MHSDVIDIPPASGRAVLLGPGDVLRVVDVEGSQVADLVAFNAADPSEYLSQGFTRLLLNRAAVAPGDLLWSNRCNPVLRLTEDRVGVHDLLFPPCNEVMYERVFGLPGKQGCRENLADALAEHGISLFQISDPLNVFMHTEIGEQQEMVILPPLSRAGDYLEMRAEMALIVGVSACAADITDCNGGRLTGIQLQVDRVGTL